MEAAVPKGKNNWALTAGQISVVLVIAAVIVVAVYFSLPKPRKVDTTKCSANSDCLNGGSCNLATSTCTCTAQWTGDRCERLKEPVAALTAVEPAEAACGVSPRECASDGDCQKCGSTVPFTCQTITEDDNKWGLSGRFCLPVQAIDNCVVVPGPDKYNERIPGVHFWEGWAEVQTQGWSCACEYPAYYPPALDAEESGACKKNTELCKYGQWIYPCKPNPVTPDKCLELSDDEKRELVGSSPLEYGRCMCENVPCTDNVECASSLCVDGVCARQRTGLDPRTGLPVCVPDTCQPYGKWVSENKPPYAYGRCVCSAGSIDTGYGCVPAIPPPPSGCPSNCNGNGTCTSAGTCVCSAGWSGDTCAVPVCADNCVNRGSCIAPNTCTCAQGTVMTNNNMCEPLKACSPAPSVNSATGTISNASNFPNSTNTGCVQGTVEQLTALCTSSACTKNTITPYKVTCGAGATWDGYSGNACFKNRDCTSTACSAAYCGANVTAVTGAIKQVGINATTCANPTLADVQAMCSAKSGNGSNYSLVSVGTSYSCANTTPRPTLQVTDLAVVAGQGLVGRFCIPMTSATQKATDGNALIGGFTIGRVIDDTDMEILGTPRGRYAYDYLTLSPTVSSTCPPGTYGSYSYSFVAYFTPGSDLAKLTPGTSVNVGIMAWPTNRWNCLSTDATYDCAPLYIMTNETDGSVDVISGTPTALTSPALLPVLSSSVAYTLTRTSSWAQTVLSQLASSSSNSIFTQTIATPLMAEPTTDSVVQVACRDTYCNFGGGVAPFKFVVMAWPFLTRPSGTLGTSCPFVDASFSEVKYTLTRTPAVGAAVTLLSPTSTVNTTMVGTVKYAYFVDVVPANGALWTYALGSYLAQPGDTTTTYDTAPCRSEMVRFVVEVKPYDDSFCRALVPPTDVSQPMPPYTWYNSTTRMCEWTPWTPSNTVASDYYCAVLAGSGNLTPGSIQLANAQGKCGVVLPSYPTLTSTWPGATCNASDSTTCLSGVTATRSAQCNKELQIQSGGSVPNFQTRMTDLYNWHVLHGSGAQVSGMDNFSNATSINNVFTSAYYKCGPSTSASTWGRSGTCDPGDAACTAAQTTNFGDKCGTTYACDSWVPQSTSTSNLQTYTQTRKCFPDASYRTPTSACCNFQGVYSVNGLDSVASAGGGCTCNTSRYQGPTCSTDACAAQTCNGHGTCDYNSTIGAIKCTCDAGYQNYTPQVGVVSDDWGTYWSLNAGPNAGTQSNVSCTQNKCLVIDSGPGGVVGCLNGGTCDTGPGMCVCPAGKTCERGNYTVVNDPSNPAKAQLRWYKSGSCGDSTAATVNPYMRCEHEFAATVSTYLNTSFVQGATISTKDLGTFVAPGYIAEVVVGRRSGSGVNFKVLNSSGGVVADAGGSSAWTGAAPCVWNDETSRFKTVPGQVYTVRIETTSFSLNELTQLFVRTWDRRFELYDAGNNGSFKPTTTGTDESPTIVPVLTFMAQGSEVYFNFTATQVNVPDGNYLFATLQSVATGQLVPFKTGNVLSSSEMFSRYQAYTATSSFTESAAVTQGAMYTIQLRGVLSAGQYVSWTRIFLVHNTLMPCALTDSCSSLKFGCNGFGECVRQLGGTYDSADQCNCVATMSGVCNPVAANSTSGTGKACASPWYTCDSTGMPAQTTPDKGVASPFSLRCWKCGPGYNQCSPVAGLTKGVCASDPGVGTFRTQTECLNTRGYYFSGTNTQGIDVYNYAFNYCKDCPLKTSDVGSLYPDFTTSPAPGAYSIYQTVTGGGNSSTYPLYRQRSLRAQGANLTDIYNRGVRFSDSSFGSPKFKYLPIILFTATAPFVTVNISGGSTMTISGGGGDDFGEVETVVVPWGNVNGLLPDPPAVGGNVTRSVGGKNRTILKATDVVHYGGSPQWRSGRGTSNTSGAFTAKMAVTPGKQYAVAIQAVVGTDDYVYFWYNPDPFRSTAPALTFSNT